MGIYIFSDIHGNLDAYNAVMEYIDKNLREHDQVVCVGDLIDRGSKSAEVVIKYAKKMQSDPRYHFVLGNHESLLLNAILAEICNDTGSDYSNKWYNWSANGGITVCMELNKKPNLFNNFFKSFLYLLDKGNGRIYVRTKHTYVITHAGLTTKNLKIEAQRDEAGISKKIIPRIWSRHTNENNVGEEKTSFEKIRKRRKDIKLDNKHRKYHVHGHTPTDIKEITRRWNESYEAYAALKEFNLPVDAGLAYCLNNAAANVACAYISSDPDAKISHSVTIIPVVGRTDIIMTRGDELDKENKAYNQDSFNWFMDQVNPFIDKASDYIDKIGRVDYKFSFLIDRQISWGGDTFKKFYDDDYRNIVPSKKAPVIKDSPRDRPLVKYIQDRRRKGKVGRGWWVRQAYQREAKLASGIWAYSILYNILTPEDISNDDIKSYYKTIIDGKLHTAIQNTMDDEGKNIGIAFLRKIKKRYDKL
ncbi:MAG: hypothetical protein GY710_10385 [Desulfobacteraceae bacterium]|nr:hypothetical protein [Desulfobacteraceae bacterium]